MLIYLEPYPKHLMLGIILTAIGICLAAFGALYPLRGALTISKEKAAALGRSYFASGGSDDIELPAAKFIWEQRKEYRRALPLIIAGIALQVIGLIITTST